MMREVEESGFFSPSIAFGLVSVDGPEIRIAAQRGSQRQVLSYHGRYHRNRASPWSSPSYDQVESFVSMWNRVMRAVTALSPETTRDYEGELQPVFPRRH